MADAYGNFSVAKSSNCVVDTAAFVSALNNFTWSTDDSHWLVSKEGKKNYIYFRTGFSGTQYPTVRPSHTTIVIVAQDDGELKRIPADEATDDDWENLYDSESAPVELNVLSEQLSAHISEGWIEIACCANEKARYVYFETLRVHADGRVESNESVSGALVEPKTTHEVYEPTH